MKPKKHILFIYFSLVNRIKIERIWKGKKTAHGQTTKNKTENKRRKRNRIRLYFSFVFCLF
jgi:hypothetical protein